MCGPGGGGYYMPQPTAYSSVRRGPRHKGSVPSVKYIQPTTWEKWLTWMDYNWTMVLYAAIVSLMWAFFRTLG
jgi:hypothetical protein